ncbi:MAG: hypothetical protein VB036_01250 [Propionicimonas sp.]|nr:hypothetical protein [Propionicimonas sp.]
MADGVTEASRGEPALDAPRCCHAWWWRDTWEAVGPTTVRSDILKAVREIVSDREDQTFTMAEVVGAMRRAGTIYAVQSIRTHIGSSMCVNAPVNHAVTYSDLERLERGRYRLVGSPPGTRPTEVTPPAPAHLDVGPDIEDEPDADSGLQSEDRRKATEPSRPIDLQQVAAVVAALAGEPLTSKIASAETALEGLRREDVHATMSGTVLSLETAVAAMSVRESLGRISDLIHASVICAALTRILEDGERIVVRPSLASGNDPTRHYDLETDRRIAEFKVAVWQPGSNVMRKRTLFADLVSLALDPRPVRKQLFVVGERPGRFLRGSKSQAHMVLQRAHQNLRDQFTLTYGPGPISVAEFAAGPASDVEVIDLLDVLEELRG